VDILQPDLAHCGGLSEGVKIRTLANAVGVDVTPHAWGTWIGFAAALHFHAVNPPNPGRFEPRQLFLECDNSENPVKTRAFSRSITVTNGFAELPREPGLGIEVEPGVLDEFIVS
jgi:D-galactarolactone cycloisomerase